MRSGMYSRRALWELTFIILFLLIAAGCTNRSAVSGSTQTGMRASEVQKGKPVFEIITPQGTSKSIYAADLKELPLAQISVEGKIEEGPRLQDVLQLAGIKDFQRVTLTGREGNVTLAKEDVTPEVLLDLTNRGTVKLASPQVPKKDWVKDITLIKVE